jgi:uncharacterized protein (TIGR00266 family)
VQHQILYGPSYSLLVVDLAAGEAIKAEPGGLVSMSGGIQMETGMQGGLFAGLRRAVLGGESFFVNTFSAPRPGEVTFAPPLSGDIKYVSLGGQTMFAQSGSFLAASASITWDTQFGGARSFFAGAGLFLLKLDGSGDVWLSSYGAIHEKTLAAGEEYVVDTGHIVAFDASMNYQVGKAGSMKSFMFGGEGLIARFTGPGRVLLQTRSPGAFLDWLLPRLPKSGTSGGSSTD